MPHSRDALIESRVTALVAAHSHLFARRLYPPFARPAARGTWQIVAGNAGSQLEDRWVARANNGYFGFTVIKITEGGRALVESHGRDYPPGQYMAPSPPEQFPTTIRDAGDITFVPA